MFDVIVDMREESPTRHGWFAVELTAETHRQLYIPVGFAHGFQTLIDDTEVFYQVTGFYHPEAARGVRWDDPLIAIEWPLEVTLMSDHDRRIPRIGARPGADNV
jgi:dTDP-4-dehydrorhamnose 3,5-epimerase